MSDSYLIIDENGVNNWYALIDLTTPFFPIGSTGDDTFWELNGHLHRDDDPAVERPDGSKLWYQHGALHRLDVPAVEYAAGTFWYQHGVLHRLNGPAVESEFGHKAWYQNGVLHRLNGPAVVWATRDNEWHVNGCQLTEDQVKFLAFTNGIEYITDPAV